MVERNWIKSNGYFGESFITSKEHEEQFLIALLFFLKRYLVFTEERDWIENKDKDKDISMKVPIISEGQRA